MGKLDQIGSCSNNFLSAGTFIAPARHHVFFVSPSYTWDSPSHCLGPNNKSSNLMFGCINLLFPKHVQAVHHWAQWVDNCWNLLCFLKFLGEKKLIFFQVTINIISHLESIHASHQSQASLSYHQVAIRRDKLHLDFLVYTGGHPKLSRLHRHCGQTPCCWPWHVAPYHPSGDSGMTLLNITLGYLQVIIIQL